MQVKKFEAPTIQEALDTIKRELGPEAIILQTKQNKRGFGLLSKSSVEITAAVSDRALTKKQFVDTRLPEPNREKMQKLSAGRQAALLDKYSSRYLDGGGVSRAESVPSQASGVRDLVNLTKQKPAPQKSQKITATRYAEIDADEMQTKRPVVTQALAKAATQNAVQAKTDRAGLDAEIQQLKRMIVELQTEQDRREQSPGTSLGEMPEGMQVPAVRDCYEQLVLAGVDKKYAFALVKKAVFELQSEGVRIASMDPEQMMDRVAVELMTSTEVLPPFAGIAPRSERAHPAVIALVGPTGVGKTTTIAKMTSEAIQKRGWKVGLINLDQYKVAAFDQLATYSKILNVPFRSVASPEDLRGAIQEFNNLDLILIDTTGRSQRDPQALAELKALLQGLNDLRVHLVLSATTRDTELYDMASRFAVFRPQGITISKLDEATLHGAMYNVSKKAKLPLLYFTTGQRVPEDIEEATQERVAALILDIS